MLTALLLLLGLAIGAGLGWFLGEIRNRGEQSLARLRLEQSEAEVRRLTGEVAKAADAQNRLAEILKAEFRNLATGILEERSRSFSETSSEKLRGLLTPVQEQLERFRKRVDEVHESHAKSASGLQEHLRSLAQLNTRLSEEARNLTAALKGDSQRRGAWGEMILQRTLELSGLERGREFELQVSTENRLRPDAVIHLPEGRFLVVDSKVSLVDYERSCNATSEEERAAALSAHAAAVRQHIKSLSEKGYPDLFEGRTPEVVMMFLPIEPAFGAALGADPDLFEFAFGHRVILVTPSTLLAALRTVTNVWKVEKQTRNVLEIARLGGVLHDKLSEFAKGLLVVRQRLAQASEAHEESLARLSSQKGNILGTATRLQELGAKAEKQMPRELLAELGAEPSSETLPESRP
jgi:DNA recombination protein RmuC